MTLSVKRWKEKWKRDYLKNRVFYYYLVLEGRPVPSKIIEKEITDAEGHCSLDVKILNLLTGELISPEKLGL